MDPNETILVIEDQQDVRLIVTHQMQKLSYRKIKQYSNSLEAFQFLKVAENVS